MWVAILFFSLAASVQLSQSQVVDIEGQNRRLVLESAPSIEVCVVLRNPTTDNSATVRIYTLSTGKAVEGLDYEKLEQEVNVTSFATRSCLDVGILDNREENGDATRRFSIFITSVSLSTGVSLGVTLLNIDISDSDVLRVAFNSPVIIAYEGNSTVDVCVYIVNGTIAAGVTVSFQFRIPSLPNPDISIAVFESFMLNSTVSSSCIQVGITNDLMIESQENFIITLRQGAIEVEFVNDTATIAVIDNDRASLASSTSLAHSVVEGNFSMITSVSLCISITSVLDGLLRDIVLNVTSMDGTATRGEDYMLDVNSLTFPSGSTMDELCFIVNITGDDVRETDESFMVIVTLATPDILGDTGSITYKVNITDDGDTNQCRILTSPRNGAVSQNGNNILSVASYSCISERFRVIPVESAFRICGVNDWDGEDPVCAAVCTSLSVANGLVILTNQVPNDFIGEGTMATYRCNREYVLNGEEERICLGTGLWSTTDPRCNAVDCGILDNPPNGGVIHEGGTTVGAMAIFTCNNNYELDGNGNRRECGLNGEWTGSQPICKESGASQIVRSQAVILIAVATMFSNLFYSQY